MSLILSSPRYHRLTQLELGPVLRALWGHGFVTRQATDAERAVNADRFGVFFYPAVDVPESAAKRRKLSATKDEGDGR